MEASICSTKKVDWEFITEVYGIVFDSVFVNSDIEPESSSLSLVNIIMKLPIISFSDKVMSYNSVFLNDP